MTDATRHLQTTNDAESKWNVSSDAGLYDNYHQLQELTIDLQRSSKRSRFGFSITGGTEYSCPITVGCIDKYHCADHDGRLKLNDILLQINDTSFVDISHKDALKVFKSAGKHMTMRIQRIIPHITEENGIRNQTSCVPSSIFNRSAVTERATTTEQVRNRTNSISVPNKPVHEYEVGIYHDLNQRNVRKGDLEMYHLISSKIASTFIPEYNEMEAVCIALRISKHHRIFTAAQNQRILPLFNYNAKEALAYTIGCNLEAKSIPTPVLIEAINLHCQTFPRIYVKPNTYTLNEKISTTRCNVQELVLHIPYLHSLFLGQLEDVLKYGNCVADLPVAIYYFLTEKKSECQPGSRNNEDLAGKYVVHREINPFTNQPKSITINIESDGTTTSEEKSDDLTTTTKTFNFKVSLRYE